MASFGKDDERWEHPVDSDLFRRAQAILESVLAGPAGAVDRADGPDWDNFQGALQALTLSLLEASTRRSPRERLDGLGDCERWRRAAARRLAAAVDRAGVHGSVESFTAGALAELKELIAALAAHQTCQRPACEFLRVGGRRRRPLAPPSAASALGPRCGPA